jgi:5-methylcytosine-specific restriction protein A
MTAGMDGPHFVEGNVYVRGSDVHDRFGGSRQSGIAPSAAFPAVFIFTGDEGQQFGYVDSWDQAEQVYTYTGEGQIGPMTYTRGNLAVRDHVQDGRSLHLFKKVSRAGGRYMYLGEMQSASTQMIRGADRNGNDRDIIQFQLVRLRAVADPAEDVGTESLFEDPSLDELRNRAYAAVKVAGTAKKDAARSVYERSRDVAIYALKRAAGLCECCGQAAPFLNRRGRPYLEVHHTDRVSDGGIDAPAKVAAICPTCHRRIHHGADGRLVNDDLRTKVAALEAAFQT